MKIGPTAHAPGGVLKWAFYSLTGETAIRVIAENGAPLSTITISPEEPARRADDGEIWVKMWGENEGVVQALLDAGIATETPEFARCGYSAAVLCRLTPAAIQDCAENLGAEEKVIQASLRLSYSAKRIGL